MDVNNNMKFDGCLGIPNKGSRKVWFQFNRPWDRLHNVWYLINDDFLLTEWASEMEYSSTDLNYSGDPRTKSATESFKETFTFTFKEAYSKSFYAELQNIYDTGDNYWLDMINGGINVKIELDYGMNNDMRMVKTYTYNCCSPMPNMNPNMQAVSLEGGFEMPLVANYAPSSIIRTGWTNSLPVSFKHLTATVVHTTATAGQVSTTISAVLDPDMVLLRTGADSFSITVVDSAGVQLPTQYTASGAAKITAVATKGVATVYVGYLIDERLDGATPVKEYQIFDIKKVTIT